MSERVAASALRDPRRTDGRGYRPLNGRLVEVKPTRRPPPGIAADARRREYELPRPLVAGIGILPLLVAHPNRAAYLIHQAWGVVDARHGTDRRKPQASVLVAEKTRSRQEARSLRYCRVDEMWRFCKDGPEHPRLESRIGVGNRSPKTARSLSKSRAPRAEGPPSPEP